MTFAVFLQVIVCPFLMERSSRQEMRTMMVQVNTAHKNAKEVGGMAMEHGVVLQA